MSSYTSVFGGNTINPTMLSYAAYTTAVDLDLVWQFEALDGSDVMAAKLDVVANVISLSVSFPKASLVSVGQDVLIRNTGANLFSVHDYAGNTLGTVAGGESWYFYLTGNSTDAGTWESVQFGTGTSSASAASLAGYGLVAATTLLNQNLPTTSLLANYTFTVNDTATVLRSGGGAVVWTFATAATLGSGWFAYVINAGSGTLTLTPAGAETIDDAATKVLQPDESCIVFCDGTQFSTVGYGRALTSTVTAQSISIAGGVGVYALSAVQAAAQVQNFTGAITGNRIVEFGTGAGYWFVYNNTTGAYTVTFRTNSLDAGVAVTQGAFSIIRSDGANMTVAFTATSGTVTSVATGTGLTGGPITTTGTVALANTAVTPGTYGGALNKTIGITVDAQGRITNAGGGDIAIPLTQVTAFSSATLRGQMTDETGTGLAVFATGPTLANPVVGTQAPLNSTTLAASTAYVDAADVVVLAAAIASSIASSAAVPGLLYGLSLSTAGSSTTFNVAAGKATNSTAVSRMSLASSYAKTVSAWSLGNLGGALDTGAIANSTWYHVFLIQRVDTSVVDVLISLSATAPTLPASYTLFRRIGSMQTNGSAQWVKFQQQGDDFYRLSALDAALGGGTVGATLVALSVPTGIVVEPFTTVVAQASNNNTSVVQYAPAADATLLYNVGYHYEGAAAGSSSANSVIGPATNTSAQVYYAQPVAGGEPNYIFSNGWRDTRGRDS